MTFKQKRYQTDESSLQKQLAKRLTTNEKKQYFNQGFVKGLPVFQSQSEIAFLQDMFLKLSSRLPKSIDINQVNAWHKFSLEFYKLCHHPAILDYVEDILGSNFYHWAGQFFVKYPNDGSEVPWHQDAQYWPLYPSQSVTVWLAVFNTSLENAAMQEVKRSHLNTKYIHRINNSAHYVLHEEVSSDQFNSTNIETVDLKAGQISLHDSRLLHGSGPNYSKHTRARITIRYCPTNVRCDLSVWPTFESYMARGEDNYKWNPIGQVPKGESYPVRKFQHSSEALWD